MSELIRNSKFISFILILVGTIRSWWQQGAICRLFAYLQRISRSSTAYRVWLRWGNAPNAAEHSLMSHFVAFAQRQLEKIGVWIANSVIYHLCSKISGYCKKSLILRLVGKLQPHQWFILAFAWYLPLEYLIRDTLHLALLSSVWEELFLLAGICLCLYRRAMRRGSRSVRVTVLDAAMLLFFAVGFFLMSVVRPYPEVALPGYRIVVQYMLWYFIILYLLEDDKDVRVLMFSFLALLAFLSLHGVYQFVIGVEIPSSWVTSTETGVRTRVFSLTGSPNILGSLLVLLTPLAASGIYYFSRKSSKIACFALVCCSLMTLLFTFSRGAWLGIMLAIIIFAVFIDRRLLAMMSAGIAACLIFVPSITSRITYLFTEDYAVASAVGGRALRWETGRILLNENNPLLGFGLGRFGGAVAMDNQLLDKTESFSYFYMDNYYLKTLVEMGWLGLLVYVLLLLVLLYLGVKAIQRSDISFAALPGDALQRANGNIRILCIGIFSGLCGVLLHCYFENIFEEPYMSAYFWGLSALLLYLGFFKNKQPDDNRKINK